jgi:hypothetical protein
MMLLKETHPQVAKSGTHFWSLLRVIAPVYWHDNFSKFLSRQQQSNNVSHTVNNHPPFLLLGCSLKMNLTLEQKLPQPPPEDANWDRPRFPGMGHNRSPHLR